MEGTLRGFKILGFGALVIFFLCCQSPPLEQTNEQGYNRLVISNVSELRTILDTSGDVNFRDIEIRSSETVTLTETDYDILNQLRCSALWIKTDSIELNSSSIASDSLSYLFCYTKSLITQGPITSVFPNLGYVQLTMHSPLSSNIFSEGVDVNTIEINGSFNSARQLTGHKCRGTQLILNSPELREFDSLHLSDLKFGIVNIQQTPLSFKLRSTFPPGQDYHKQFEIADSIVFVY